MTRPQKNTEFYTIRVKTVDNKAITYHNVKKYEVKDGYVHFTDSKTGKTKIYAVANTEIQPQQPLPGVERRETPQQSTKDCAGAFIPYHKFGGKK